MTNEKVLKIKARAIGFNEYLNAEKFAESFIIGNSKYNLSDYTLLPGFCDVHVHFREPGFAYKETILSGSLAAAHGGYTAVCTMPNLNPVPDSAENLLKQTDIIKNSAKIKVYPYGAITVGEKGESLSDMAALANNVVAFSDDGKGVQSAAIMQEAMQKAKSLNKIIVAHCEDNSLLNGGYIRLGTYSEAHGHVGIDKKSEWKAIERDLNLVLKTGAAYHVCHISCKESVELIKDAKKSGLNVTCETAPHYLILTENDLQEDGRFKMNPPLGSEEDKLALISGIESGVIDMIATDHAPHSQEEKSRGLRGSAFGIVGLETAFPLLYTYLVKQNVISLNKLIELIAINPRKRFDIPLNGDFSVWNLNESYVINPNDFLSKGKSTPFEGKKVFGKHVLTVCDGKPIL